MDSPYTPFFYRNKLTSLTKRYGVVDTAWLLDVFITLTKQDFRNDTRSCFCCLQELCRIAGLTEMKRDIFTDFVQSSLLSSYFQKELDLSLRPLLPSLVAFKDDIIKRCLDPGFPWHQGEEGEGGGEGTGLNAEMSANHAYMIRTEWVYDVVKASELGHKQFLVGDLGGCDRSGFLVLRDRTGAIPVIPILPKWSCPTPTTDHKVDLSRVPLTHYGNKLIVSDFWIILEKSTDQNCSNISPPDVCVSIHPIESTVIPVSCDSVERGKDGVSKSFQATAESFLFSDGDDADQTLYFKVLNKNIVTINSFQKREFTCQVLIHPCLDTLINFSEVRCAGSSSWSECAIRSGGSTSSSEERPSSTSDTDFGKKPLRVAMFFSEAVFKWFSLISNECVYSLGLMEEASDLVLPTWSVLEKNLSLTVTEDMVIKLLSIFDGCVLDVADLTKQLLLPSFQTTSLSNPSSKPKLQLDLVSLRGIIVSHSYRIDHMTLVRTVPNLSGSTSSTNQCKIIALGLCSLKSPDEIKVYCDYRDGVPLPVGLVPGAVVTLNSFKLKTSKSGNFYCTSCALSSIDVDSLDNVMSYLTMPRRASCLTTPVSVPVSWLSELTFLLIGGELSKSVVCVRVSYLTVKRLSLNYKCRTCQCTIVNENCTTTCIRKRPTFEVTARLFVEDGSGSAHMYLSEGELVRNCLCVAQAEWKDLCDLVTDIGHVVYTNRSHYKFQATENVVVDRSKLSNLDRAKHMMWEVASRPSIQRKVKLLCTPFVSQEERERSILGQKTHTFKLKGLEFTTLSLPRLQLKGLSLVEGCYASECEKLLALLE